MSDKKTKVKSIPVAVAIIGAIIAFFAMAVLFLYVITPAESDVSTDNSITQSFETESSLEPPPVSAEVKEHMSDANVGDIVLFGKYEQNAVLADGAEAIEWQVLQKDEEEGKLLLISRYCLETVRFNNSREAVEWEQSSLENWLNGEFLNNSFTSEETSFILNNGETEEKVFILTATEADDLFVYNSWRAGVPTAQAVANGARTENGYCWWWLKDKGSIDNSATYVHFDGTIRNAGFAVDYDLVTVRPVIWVSAEAETETEHAE